MTEQEKRRQNVGLGERRNQAKKISEIIEVSLWPPSCLDINPIDFAIWGLLENKTNATFHPHIGSLKTAFEEE